MYFLRAELLTKKTTNFELAINHAHKPTRHLLQFLALTEQALQ